MSLIHHHLERICQSIGSSKEILTGIVADFAYAYMKEERNDLILAELIANQIRTSDSYYDIWLGRASVMIAKRIKGE